jgi:hypothetical protein
VNLQHNIICARWSKREGSACDRYAHLGGESMRPGGGEQGSEDDRGGCLGGREAVEEGPAAGSEEVGRAAHGGGRVVAKGRGEEEGSGRESRLAAAGGGESRGAPSAGMGGALSSTSLCAALSMCRTWASLAAIGL